MSNEQRDISRILVVHPSPSTRAEIARILRGDSIAATTLQEAGSVTEGLRLARWFDPRFVLVDLMEERGLALEVARELRRADRRLIGLYNPLLLREREVDLFRDAARAGFGDFVPLPASESELRSALLAIPTADARRKRGRTVAFFGANGGSGVSTVAANTALVMAGSGEVGEVALCDAALQFGVAAAYLGIRPDRDLADMARDLDDLGALSAYLSRHPDTGLQVLARPRHLADAEQIDPESLSRMLIRLEQRFDHVAVDLPAVVDLMTMAALDLAEKVILVTEATAPAVIATGRLLRLLQEQGFGAERLRLVVNRYIANDGLPPGRIAEQLGRPVDYVIEYERALVGAAHRGQPLILTRQRGEFQTTIGRIADDIAAPVLQRTS